MRGLWLIGGIDPTGGAGLIRDRITAGICVPGIPVREVVTADTVQGDGRPARSTPRPFRDLLVHLGQLGTDDVVKLGLVPEVHVQPELLARLAQAQAVIVDPVLRASDGGELGASPASCRQLAEVATLVTPNLPEARALVRNSPQLSSGDLQIHATIEGDPHSDLDGPESPVGSGREPSGWFEQLRAVLPAASVLLKGGHGRDPVQVEDRLWHRGHVYRFVRPRRFGHSGRTHDPRGTGCALATAIACGIWQGRTMVDAVAHAIAWLDQVRGNSMLQPSGALHLPSEGPPLAQVQAVSPH